MVGTVEKIKVARERGEHVATAVAGFILACGGKKKLGKCTLSRVRKSGVRILNSPVDDVTPRVLHELSPAFYPRERGCQTFFNKPVFQAFFS
jgi:hypothetical protein